MSKDVDSMKDNPQSSRPEIPAYWLNWSSLWDRQLKRAISEWDTGAFRHLNRQYEALRQAFEAFHVEISPLDAAALQSARAAFLTRHATESRIHSEEDVLLCFILTEEEMKWRRVLLTAADDGVEEASEELHIECSADLATAFLFAAVIDRSLADLLTYGMVAVSETEAPGELLYRMMELVEDTVLSLDIGADPEDGLERAVKEKLLERVSNARIGALLERLESDDTRVHLARDIGVMQMNLNEKPTDLFTQADRIGQYGKVHNLRFVDDHRYLGRALIDLVAQDFRDARWEDVCESAEALVSTGELAPVSESLLTVFSDWAALQCVEKPHIHLDKITPMIPVMQELHSLTELCRSIRLNGLRFVADPTALDGLESPGVIGQALALIVTDEECPDVSKMVELGDISDQLLKGNLFAKSLGAWLRTIQAIILFRRGRYAYAKRVATYALTLIVRSVDEREVIEDMLRRIISDSAAAE